MSCPEPVPEPRLDRFHAGAFSLLQPVGRGFRAGLDAMLLAATVPSAASGRLADLGAGTGAVGFAAASRAPGVAVLMAECVPEVAALLRASVAHPDNARLAARLGVAEVDLLGGRAERERAGLADAGFGRVLSNPPFFPAGFRASPDAARRTALSAAGPDFLVRWVRAAAALVAPRGTLSLVARPDDLPAIAEVLANRLGGLVVLPVHTREGPARRILVGARRGSRAPLSILPALTLFAPGGAANETSRRIADGIRHVALFEEER